MNFEYQPKILFTVMNHWICPKRIEGSIEIRRMEIVDCQINISSMLPILALNIRWLKQKWSQSKRQMKGNELCWGWRFEVLRLFSTSAFLPSIQRDESWMNINSSLNVWLYFKPFLQSLKGISRFHSYLRDCKNAMSGDEGCTANLLRSGEKENREILTLLINFQLLFILSEIEFWESFDSFYRVTWLLKKLHPLSQSANHRYFISLIPSFCLKWYSSS